MRDFFIRGLEVVLNVVVAVAALAIVVLAGLVAFAGDSAMTQGLPVRGMTGGPVAGLLVLVGGFLYLVVVAGFMYLGLGIYQNTRRMADALDRGGPRP